MDKVLKNAELLGAVPFLDDAYDLCSGNSKLNMLFTASIFNANSGLDDEEIDEEVLEKIKAALDSKDGDPREER